jgi:murein DD-endopeptidase MepM/ murein hydrolase activator NlpD
MSAPVGRSAAVAPGDRSDETNNKRTRMRHDYLITVSDVRGSSHFRLTRAMRRALVGVSAGLAVVAVVGIATIGWLGNRVGSLDRQVAELTAERDAVREARDALAEERDTLADELRQRSRELAMLGSEIQRVETLVGLSPGDDAPMMQRIDAAAQTAFERRLMLRSIPSGYPVASRKVTSDYGMRLHPIADRKAMHGGVDLRAKRGTPVYATADGVIEWAAHHESSGLGRMVKVVHNYGFSTTYGHLDDIEVAPGAYVKRGDLLGYSGNTGRSTAAHLHYEVRYLQRRLDPSPFLRWSLEDYDVLFSEEDRVQWESLTEVVRTAARVPERRSSQPAQSLSATSP